MSSVAVVAGPTSMGKMFRSKEAEPEQPKEGMVLHLRLGEAGQTHLFDEIMFHGELIGGERLESAREIWYTELSPEGQGQPDAPPDEAIKSLLEEKTGLVCRKFGEGLSEAEERRLMFLEWRLDRIALARAQPDLDRLERIVLAHERFAMQVDDWVQQARSYVEEANQGRRSGFSQRR